MKTSIPLIITISRQLGSGGAAVGQQLAEKLNIRCVNREIVSRAAKKLSVMEQELDERDEKMQSFWKSFFQFNALATEVAFPPGTRITTTGEVFRVESEILQHVAKEESAVIIGRCGYAILKDYPNLITVYLHADKAFRVDRIAHDGTMTTEEASEVIEKNDKERGLYIETFTGNKWSDARHFDLCIDTGKIGIDKAVEIILNYVKLRCS
ncbi:MAG: Cytidylate kinase [Bacteroidetes bacterium]|nr:Cytidylate kinase [Bacteroidota bacterium]